MASDKRLPNINPLDSVGTLTTAHEFIVEIDDEGDVVKQKCTVSDIIAVIDHNSTANIQGGSSNKYYHLTDIEAENVLRMEDCIFTDHLFTDWNKEWDDGDWTDGTVTFTSLDGTDEFRNGIMIIDTFAKGEMFEKDFGDIYPFGKYEKVGSSYFHLQPQFELWAKTRNTYATLLAGFTSDNTDTISNSGTNDISYINDNGDDTIIIGFSSAHGLRVNDLIRITGLNDSTPVLTEYNGWFFVLSVGNSGTSIRIDKKYGTAYSASDSSSREIVKYTDYFLTGKYNGDGIMACAKDGISTLLNASSCIGLKIKLYSSGASGDVLHIPKLYVTLSGTDWTEMSYSKTTTEWVASTAYAVGDIVIPVGGNGYSYICTTAGTSDSTEPTWAEYSDAEITDNTATWELYGIINSEDNTETGGLVGNLQMKPVLWCARNNYSTDNRYLIDTIKIKSKQVNM